MSSASGLKPTFQQFNLQQALAHIPKENRGKSDKKTGPFGLTFLSPDILNGFHKSMEFYDYCFTQAFPRGDDRLLKLQELRIQVYASSDRTRYLEIERQIKQLCPSKEELLKRVNDACHYKACLEWHIHASAQWRTPEYRQKLFQSFQGTPEFGRWKVLEEEWQKTGVHKYLHYSSTSLLQCATLLEEFDGHLDRSEDELKPYQSVVKALFFVDEIFRKNCLDYMRSLRLQISRERKTLCYAMFQRLQLAAERGDLSDDDILFSLAQKTAEAVKPFFQFKGLTPEALNFFHHFIITYGWKDSKPFFSLNDFQWLKGLINCQFVVFKGQLFLIPAGVSEEELDRVIGNTYRGPSPYDVACWNISRIQLHALVDKIKEEGLNHEKMLAAFRGASRKIFGQLKSISDTQPLLTKWIGLKPSSFYSRWKEMLHLHLHHLIEDIQQMAEFILLQLPKNKDDLIPKVLNGELLKELALWVREMELHEDLFPKARTLVDSMKEIEQILSHIFFYRIMHLENYLEQRASPLTGLSLCQLINREEFLFLREAFQGFHITPKNEAARTFFNLLLHQAPCLDEIEKSLKQLPAQYHPQIFFYRFLGSVVQLHETFPTPLLELVNAYDQKYRNTPSIRNTWIQQKEEGVSQAYRSLMAFLQTPSKATPEQPLEALLAYSNMQPKFHETFKTAVIEALKRFDGSHPFFSRIVMRLQDPEMTFLYGTKRFNYLFPQHIGLFLQEIELQEMIFSHTLLNQRIFDAIRDTSLQQAMLHFEVPFLGRIFGHLETEIIIGELDKVYFERLKESVDQKKASQFEEDTATKYKQFPSTEEYQIKVREYLTDQISRGWSWPVHQLIQRLCPEYVVQISRLKWLEAALNQESASDYGRQIHHVFIGFSFLQLSNFYGPERLNRVFELTKLFLSAPSNNRRMYELFQDYYFEASMPEDLSPELQPDFQTYRYLCSRIEELSKTQEIAQVFKHHLETSNFKAAFACYETLLNKKEVSNDGGSVLFGITLMEQQVFEWVKDQFSWIDNIEASKKLVQSFRLSFFAGLKPDRFKQDLTDLLDREDRIRNLHCELVARIHRELFENRQWLLGLTEIDVEDILKVYNHLHRKQLSTVIATISLHGMDLATKEATTAFRQLLLGTSKNEQNDYALILRTLKLVRYVPAYKKLSDEKQKESVLHNIESLESVSDAKWISHRLQLAPILPNSNRAQNLENWERALLGFLIGAGGLSPSECIQSVRFGERRLSPLFVDQIIDREGKLRSSRLNLKIGNQEVNLHFFPEKPWGLFLTNTLEHLLFRTFNPFFELLRFPATTGRQSGPYCVLASQVIPGKSLIEILTQGSSISPSSISYSERVLGTLLLSEQACAPDRYVISPLGDLICIDIQQSVETSSSGPSNILFCFDQMLHPFAPEVVEYLHNLDIYVVLKSWLLELKRLNDRLLEIYPRGFQQLGDLAMIPFRDQYIEEMWSRLSILQQLFRSNSKCTPLQLLEALQPNIASFYAKELRIKKTPYERYLTVNQQKSSLSEKNLQQSQYSNLSSLASQRVTRIDLDQALERLEELQGQVEQLGQVRTQLKAGNLQPFIKLSSSQAKEAVINGESKGIFGQIILGTLPQQIQKSTLEAMCSTSWTKLLLSKCNSLDDALLLKLLQVSPNLVTLDISYCSQLTEKVLQYIQNHCPHVQILMISGLPFKALNLRGKSFRELKRVVIQDCSYLSAVSLKCRALEFLDVKNCPLQSLEIVTRVSAPIVQGARLPLIRGLIVGKLTSWTLVCTPQHPRKAKMLHGIVEQGSYKELEGFKGKKINCNTPNIQGLTPLHLALLSSRPDKQLFVDWLLAHGANVNTCVTLEHSDYKGSSPAHLLVEIGDDNRNLWMALKKAGADFNIPDFQNLSPLLRACEKNKKNLVELLLELSVDVNMPSTKGLTALHIASGKNNRDIVQLLLSKNGQVGAVTIQGQTPFDSACTVGAFEVADLLSNRGADINHQKNDGTTILHDACKWGDLLLVEYLLKKGIVIHKQAQNGRTALHVACDKGILSVVQKLISAGARVDALAIEIATSKKHIEVIAYLATLQKKV